MLFRSMLLCLKSFNPPDLEKESRAKEIEATIRATAVDANADVRKVARKIFDAYKILLPRRVQRCVLLQLDRYRCSRHPLWQLH